MVELCDGRREPFTELEIARARTMERRDYERIAARDDPWRHPDAGRQVPHHAAGVMVVGRARGVVVGALEFLPEMTVDWSSGRAHREGRTLKLPCPACRRHAELSERTVGRVLDGLYRVVPVGADGRRIMTLAMIEQAVRLL